MRIKVLVSSVTRFGQYQQGEVDLPEAEAAELLGRGWAIPIEEAAAEPVSTETVLNGPKETAAGPVSTETEAGQPELESAALGKPEETAAEPAPRRKRKSS
jgi:hypothetical protein